MRGFWANIRASPDPSAAPLRAAHRITDMAPMINRRRMSRCPIFDVRPSRGLPAVECCRGTRPSQAAKSRPRLKITIGGAKASIAAAVIGLIPGMVCKHVIDAATAFNTGEPWGRTGGGDYGGV